jgi:hypothetical protein
MSVRMIAGIHGGTGRLCLRGYDITTLSFRPRLLFDCSEVTRQSLFTETNDDLKLDSAYLPSRDALVESMSRLKALHPQLRTFKLVLEFSTFDTFLDKDWDYKTLLEFEYREADTDSVDYPRLPFCQNMDLRGEPMKENTPSYQVRYVIHSDAIRDCYDQLVWEDEGEVEREAERIRQPEALQAANGQVALEADADVDGADVEGGAGSEDVAIQ